MKKISLFFIMIMVANTLFSQVIYYPNFSTKTAVMCRLGFLEKQGLSYTLGSGHGSFFTANYGVQTKTGLGDSENSVLFCFETMDQYKNNICPRIVSGTESINRLVKELSSKSTFNGNVETSIDIHVGDVFSVQNVELHFFATFKVVSYDETNEELIIEFVDNIESGNFVVPEYVEFNNEKYLVTEIGNNAFSGCTNLTSITIPNSVTSIGRYAFEGCTALSRVTCYAVNPPDAVASSFSNYNGYLTIPCDNFEAYDIHPVWGNFKHIECISAESTELPKDEVVVEPEISEAVFSMPTNASANSYTLTIQNNGVTFCTLTFNNQGQLANIDFSNSQLKAAVEGYQFTVTGLSASTGYNYSFKALDKNKSVLKEYTGAFTTKNADGTGGSTTTAIDDVEFANAISIVNNQIFVNGEAPEFVITSLGQKIANQNLQAGVYFVQVGNEKQGVAVK